MTGDASGYGVPHKCLRLYIVAVLVVANPQFDFLERPVRATFQTLRALLKVCVRASPCASEVIYAAADERVLAWLHERQELQATRRPACYAFGKAITRAALSGVSWSAVHAPEWLKASPWFQTLTVQQKQVAAYSLCTDIAPVLFRDVSQSCSRVRTTSFCERWPAPELYRNAGASGPCFPRGGAATVVVGRGSDGVSGLPCCKGLWPVRQDK